MPVRIVICKSRRAGLSTGVSALIYDDTTTHPNSKSLIVANEKNPSENVLGMYTRFWKECPDYMEVGGQRITLKPALPPEYNNNPPKDRLLFAPPLDSGIYVATARSIDAFLGYGFQNMHATEASRYQDGHELFRSLYPTLSSEPHSALYIESTPNGQEGKGRWFYEQCLSADTQVLTKRGFVGPDEIRDDDEIAGFDLKTSAVEWRPITGKVDRLLGDGEEMFEIQSPGSDIRVTGGHRMVYRANAHSQWEVATAAELAARQGPYEIPVAHAAAKRGVNLSDDQLRFIAWVITDGSVHKDSGQVEISQAQDSPFHDEIVRCLKGCGFKYNVTISPARVTQFTRNSPLVRYIIPRREVVAIVDYCDKELHPFLDEMGCAQFSVFAETLHFGDGEKQQSKRFTQGSYHIGTGRLRFAERLQSLAIRCGWRASLSHRLTPTGGDYWTVRIKKSVVRTISGAGELRPRPRLQKAQTNGERVWCVKNDLSTLVIRRNGKTAIVGNCMDAQARKDTQYGEMRLVFIPWHEMTYSFAITFADDEKRVKFGKSLTGVEKNLMQRFPHITLEQINWRRMVLAGPTFNSDDDMFDQEYPTDLATAFLLSGHSVFGRKTIKRLMESVREPVWEGDIYYGDSPTENEREPVHELVRRPHFYTAGEARSKGFGSHVNEGSFKNLKVYRWPKKGDRVFVTADVGRGNPESRDGDYSVLMVGVLNELAQDELIMTWRGHVNPVKFAEIGAALCWAIRYMVGEKVAMPEFIPEWNGPGTALCTYADQKNLYPVYKWQPFGKSKLPKTHSIGWQSDAKTKPYMIAWTLHMVDRGTIDIPDANLVLEMSNYRQLDNMGDEGSYGGAAGRHDDMVSAFQILCSIMRLRSATIPGDADAEEIEENYDFDPELPDFDPFRGERSLGPGVLDGDLDEGSLEETLFWSAADDEKW